VLTAAFVGLAGAFGGTPHDDWDIPGAPARSCRGRRTGCPANVLGRVFAEAGLGFKLVWLATRRRFAVREERTFRYA